MKHRMLGKRIITATVVVFKAHVSNFPRLQKPTWTAISISQGQDHLTSIQHFWVIDWLILNGILYFTFSAILHIGELVQARYNKWIVYNCAQLITCLKEIQPENQIVSMGTSFALISARAPVAQHLTNSEVWILTGTEFSLLPVDSAAMYLQCKQESA